MIENLLVTAKHYRALGWKPLPCDGKNPNIKKWQAIDPDDATLSSRLSAAKNPAIGVRLGPTSGIIDIEWDSPAQRAKAFELFGADLLDNCPAFGRPEDPNHEHRLLAWDDRLNEVGKANLNVQCDDDTSLIVRLGAAGKGSQSVFPPSPRKEWLPERSIDNCAPPQLPDLVIERLIAAAKQRQHKPPQSAVANVEAGCLADMLTVTKNMEDGNDGSKRLFVAVCRTKEHDLSPDAALATINEYLRQRPAPTHWSDDQIRERIAQVEAREDVIRGSAVTITNYREMEITDDSGTTKKVAVPLSMNEIIDNIRRFADDWPRRVDNMLFVTGSHGIDYFDRRTTAGLIGWLRRQFAVKWKEGGSFVSQSELFAEIERTAPRYDGIELLPHERPIDGIYYRWPTPPAGDGKHLRWLVDRFNPETTVDRDLIQAAIMTTFWGGPPGTRPAIVITSDDGRGVGKTTVVRVISFLCGGSIDVSANEDIATLKTRLLTPSARMKRVGNLDNVKASRFSWAELEALITAPVISGKQNYVGEGQRPNLLTYFVTLNGINLGTDLAQRSIIIKLVRGEYSGTWLEDTLRYIDQHRQALIGDIIGALRAEQKALPAHTRWGDWEKEVLSRLPNPAEAQRLILERQSEANAELEEAEMIEEFFADQLQQFGHNPAMAQLRIPSGMAAEWYCNAIGRQMKTQSATKRLSQMAKEGQLKRIAPDPSHTYGRCFIWTGDAADVIHDPIQNELVLHHKQCALALAKGEAVTA